MPSRPVTRTLQPPDLRRVRELLQRRGHGLRTNPKNEYIAFEVRTEGRSIFTAYTSGKLVSTVREGDLEGLQIAEALDALFGSVAEAPRRSGAVAGDMPWLAGVDETGTGELLGRAIVSGALLPRTLAPRLHDLAGHVETKQSRAAAGWDRLGQQLSLLRADGLVIATLAIPNGLFDTYSKNALLDLAYIRVVGDLLAASAKAGVEPGGLQLALDDYGVGRLLERAAGCWRDKGIQVVIKNRADDTHLAARVGSVAARAQRSTEMTGLRAEAGSIGTGNAGDRQTKAWLVRHAGSGSWPSFVKASFKTVRELDGLPPVTKKKVPALEELLDTASAAALLAGELDTARARLQGPAGRPARTLDVGLTGGPRGRRTPAWDFLPLLCGGLVLGDDVTDLGELDLMLDRETGLLSGWRVLVGPRVDEGDPFLVTLARAHRNGLIQLVPCDEDDPVARAKARAGVLVTRRPRPPVLALKLPA